MSKAGKPWTCCHIPRDTHIGRFKRWPLPLGDQIHAWEGIDRECRYDSRSWPSTSIFKTANSCKMLVCATRQKTHNSCLSVAAYCPQNYYRDGHLAYHQCPDAEQRARKNCGTDRICLSAWRYCNVNSEKDGYESVGDCADARAVELWDQAGRWLTD